MKIGVVGLGAIGHSIAAFAAGREAADLSLAGVCDTDAARAREVAREFGVPALSFLEILDASDLLVEATAAQVMPDLVRAAVSRGMPVLALSVGGFALDEGLEDFVRASSGHVLLPSGGIIGIDGLLALGGAGLEEVEITTTKAPRSLAGAPYFRRPEHSSLLDKLDGPRLVFNGSAREAIRAFPANVNLAITVSLAGIGMDRTRIKIFADPAARATRQRLSAKAGALSLVTEVEGPPMPENPRTSLLAAQSAKALLAKQCQAVRVGT